MSAPSPSVVHRHVVLPALVVLTVVTGVVDAVSFVALGQVFVAVMTGNIVFIALGLTGTPGATLLEPLLALTAFLAGAFAAGRLINSRSEHSGRVLFAAVGVELASVLGAVLIAALGLHLDNRVARLAIVVLLAFGFAVQTACVRHLGVRDFTTTLLTLSLTGIAADSRPAGGPGARLARRSISILALLGGALVGAALVTRTGLLWPLVLVATLLTAVLAATARSLRATTASDWATPRP
ncbi:MAG: DUF1275 domain-containing protein [Pseudonocardia sp.]|nr:DUF1275 domain-containing protein [Pseudonocardia sp.]